MRRLFATVLTLGLLSGMLLAVILGVMVAFDFVSLGLAIVGVVAFNLLLLLVGPTVNCLIYRWFFDLEWITFEELRERSPTSATVIEEVTAAYDYPTPKLRFIDVRNPNAFTYRSGRFNARIVVTEGCFEFLDDELDSVVATSSARHEP